MSPPPLADRLKDEKPPPGGWIVWVAGPLGYLTPIGSLVLIDRYRLLTFVDPIFGGLLFYLFWTWILGAPLLANVIVLMLRRKISGRVQRNYGAVIWTLVAACFVLVMFSQSDLTQRIYEFAVLLGVSLPIACGIHLFLHAVIDEHTAEDETAPGDR